jgi:hypothetical protein
MFWVSFQFTGLLLSWLGLNPGRDKNLLVNANSPQYSCVSMPANPISAAATVHAPWSTHPTLIALQTSLQITSDCWSLLAAPDGTSRKEQYLPKGEREPETAYRKRLDAARPSGFFRDALRTYAGMLSRGSWINLPASLASVLTDVDGVART